MPSRVVYKQFVQAAYEREKHRIGEEMANSLKQIGNSVPLFGYVPPRWMLDFGATCAFLYSHTGIAQYADQTKNALLFYRDWVKDLPLGAATQRPEYADGIPPMEPVFYPVIFTPAVQSIRETLSSSELDALINILAESLKLIWRFPEWGGHNRAMLRAAGLALAAQAFPDHADANRWSTLADELAEESWGRWSIEDAMLYQPHWLRALFIYARARGREKALLDFIQPRMYLKAITQLISPLDILPDYGDSHWLMHSHWEWMACLEWGASAYDDPSMKWTANRIYEGRKAETPSVYLATVASLAWKWSKDEIPAEPPVNQGDALDDLVLKKMVWRTGWDSNASYACLNYRDEGDYGRVARDYLRSTLAVSAEKMHHGHADEGSFSLLAHNGTLLLHESGYREQPPDGIYRSDVYHNRVVWRSGGVYGKMGLLEFIRGDGRYQSVKTERLYQTRLGDCLYNRIRVTDDMNGAVWDRSVIFLPDLPCWLVIDSILAIRTDYRILSLLWWTTDILSHGEGWYVTHIRGIQDWRNKKDAALFIAVPKVPGQSGTCSIEPFRRHFQDEVAIMNTWCGEHRAGHYINFVSALWPQSYSPQDENRSKAIEVIMSQPINRGICVHIKWQDQERRIAVLNDLTCSFGQEDIRPTYTAERGLAAYGSIASDAAFVMVGKTGRDNFAGFINGTYLSYDNKELYKGLPHAMFQENRTALPGIPARFRWESSSG